MKKKRIILHGCILVLTIICIITGAYAGYFVINNLDEDERQIYNNEYSYDVVSLLDYSSANRELRTNYLDDSKILIKNKSLGNVTVAEIKRIFKDKYSGFYLNGDYFDYSEYLENEKNNDSNYLENEKNNDSNYLENEKYDDSNCLENENHDDSDYLGNDEYGDKSGKETLYYADVKKRNDSEEKWKKNPSKKNEKVYLYYKKKCEYVDEYARLVETLVKGYKYDMGAVDEYDDNNFLLNKTYPVVNSGMLYYISYNYNGDKYVVTNVDSSNFFKNAVDNKLEDLTTLKDNLLVQDSPLCGGKNFSEYIVDDRQKEFLNEADEINVAIGGNDENTVYGRWLETIKKQPEQTQLSQIRRNVLICVGVVIGTLLVSFVLYIMLLVMAGHKEKGDAATLNEYDNLWWDAMLIIGCVVLGAAYYMACKLYYIDYFRGFVLVFTIVSVPAVEFALQMSESLMRRLKMRAFIKTSLIGKIWMWMKRVWITIKKCIKLMLENMSLTVKVVGAGAILFAGQFLTVAMTYYDNDMSILFLGMIVIAIGCCLAWKYFDEVRTIKEATEKIANGDVNYKIEETMKFGLNKSLKEQINGIGVGLNEAVESNMKNERMKTELITNVSHDLKTPLTSIINYVDLLKTEGLDSEKAEKYLNILDTKSQRLKQLTEDLVEASKLNSGAIKLECTRLDIVQLVNQSLGEYDEKFNLKKLQIVKKIEEEPIWVMADGRKTWRLFDNLYNNIYKYAMEGTRVYLDVRKDAEMVVVSVKNISEQPLNFSADELMERFVRGDVSRTTEGSGLGLSIARSIAERHGGELKIKLDGDLFKVEVLMKEA